MQPQAPAASGAESSGQSRQYLSFALGEEEYGLEILKVQEIRGWSGITPIPGTAGYMKGVMNLRGTVIPVVDLRTKFGMEAKEYSKFTVIIVVTVGIRIVGLVVDAVSDVLDIAAAEIRPAPEMGSTDTSFISGMGMAGEKLVVLLDIEKLLKEELSALQGPAAEAPVQA